MINFQGIIQVLPEVVVVDSGDLTTQEGTEKAIILKVASSQGEVHIVFPEVDIDEVIKNLQQVANTKLQIATSINEAEQLAKPTK